ncbi:hypothetical protein B0H15DRAFT_487585 [Mycena belliarum]|uniref:DUF6533 domain-containing protein n=1 Tax=Mycena belliarum TaxID=1033014 RepID=A0AAD6TYU1_9AGAR|nr:hypothetical protein B0H15DRAFT_487585 [Mycena belliae]
MASLAAGTTSELWGSVLDSIGIDPATFAWDHQISRSFFVAGLIILIYDHLLTFGSEVKYVWSSRLRPSTCWFLAVRYIGLASNITILVFHFGDLSHEVCVTMQIVWEVFLVSQEVLVECTLGLRVFAMYGLNFWVLVCLLGVGGLAASLAMWAIIEYGQPQVLDAPGLHGCHVAFPRSSALRLAGAWEAQIWRSSTRYRGTLIERMLTDGAMYFGIIVVTNLANLTTFYLGDVLLSGFLSWFTTSLSVTLLSRLMLNLHEAAQLGTGSTEPDTIDLETLRFPTVPITVDQADWNEEASGL